MKLTKRESVGILYRRLGEFEMDKKAINFDDVFDRVCYNLIKNGGDRVDVKRTLAWERRFDGQGMLKRYGKDFDDARKQLEEERVGLNER